MTGIAPRSTSQLTDSSEHATPGRGGLSIQQKLPLLMATILVVVLATSLALTYRALRNAAESTLAERVTNVAKQLGSLFDASVRVRATLLVRTTHDSLVHRALREPRALPTASAESLSATLGKLRLPADSELPVELWSADGHRVASVGPSLSVDLQHEVERRPPPPPRVPNDSVVFGEYFVSNGGIYYETNAPVLEAGQRIGYIVMVRRIAGQSSSARQVRDLLGSNLALYLHNDTGPVWTNLEGQLMAPPARRIDARTVARGRVGDLFTATATIAGTPWALTVEAPLAVARSSTRSVVLSLAAVSLLLTLAGALVAWLIGRRVTQPIVQLTAAAEAISRGDYRSRVVERGDGEVIRLARSFNRMAGEVDASHAQLGSQFDDARRMASDLEGAYGRLQDAMRDVEDARDAAEHANRAKSDFLAIMSHELRTPLNAIGGYVELLQLGIHGPVTDAQEQALSRIARSHKHLLTLITDVLNFARLGAGKLDFDISDVSMEEAFATVEAMVTPQLQAKQLHYSRTQCDATVGARADQEKVHQILLNLLSNAVKFTPVDGSVTVTCTSHEQHVEIAIHDTGVGVPTDRYESIFEPFVQVDRALSRLYDGVGLGLAISRDLARAMGGDIRVQSVMTEGSTFTVVLPAAKVRRATARAS